LKVAVATIAVLPVVPKAVATSVAVSMVHRLDAVSIESVLQVHPKVVGLNANASSVDPKADDSSVSASLARAAANSNAIDLLVHHVAAVTIVIVTPVVQKETDMNATGSPALPAATKWTAIDLQDLLTSMVPIEIDSPVHPNVVASIVLVRLVLHSRHV
jgi:hypothetical protein